MLVPKKVCTMGIWWLIIRNYAQSIYPLEYWALLHSPIPIRQLHSPPFRGVHMLPSHNRPKPSVATAKLRFPPQRPLRGPFGGQVDTDPLFEKIFTACKKWGRMEFSWLKPQHFRCTDRTNFRVGEWHCGGILAFHVTLLDPRKKNNNWFFRQEAPPPPSVGSNWIQQRLAFPSKLSSLKCRKHQHNGRNLSTVGGNGRLLVVKLAPRLFKMKPIGNPWDWYTYLYTFGWLLW